MFVTIIEDHPYMRRSLERFLMSGGFRCVCFDSAKNFLASPNWKNTDCLVLDVTLGDMDGFELQERLKAEGCTFPRIFFTGRSDPEAETRARNGGAYGFFRKAGSPEELLEAIRGAVALKKVRRKGRGAAQPAAA